MKEQIIQILDKHLGHFFLSSDIEEITDEILRVVQPKSEDNKSRFVGKRDAKYFENKKTEQL